ncbi:recombination regulator RecX [Uliginosibacterium sp. H3]|uniref:Regulatory protein RecX n=1 Tax=Uliginosibacterium silvisoli TaxID=3114758 RepID=A0ABU6JZX9_9RHOO|nr:recombination regulator RecX [Uliginosibacterium sp. H3]
MKKQPATSLKSKALRMLATREHSRAELKRKLSARAEEGDDVEAVLDRMAETGLQSDERFAESYVRSRAGRLGSNRLQYELIKRGVTADVADTALSEVLEEDELTRARGVWSKKFGQPPEDRQAWARQARFLQSRGFSAEVIRKLLRDGFDEPAEG